jgi:hypothetical protein
MKSYEAMSAMVGKDVEAHAKALHVSGNLVYRQCEPRSDFETSGALNPLDRLEVMIRTALGCGRSKKEATAPTQYLAHAFNQVVIDVPAELKSPKEVMAELSLTIEEFSHVTAETAKAMEDGRISAPEAERIHKEVWHLVQCAIAFEQKVQQSVT